MMWLEHVKTAINYIAMTENGVYHPLMVMTGGCFHDCLYHIIGDDTHRSVEGFGPPKRGQSPLTSLPSGNVMAIENGHVQQVFPGKRGDFPYLC